MNAPIPEMKWAWTLPATVSVEYHEKIVFVLEAQNRQLREALLKRGLSYAPCDICGYNGPGYYQPVTHPCAALAATEPKARCGSRVYVGTTGESSCELPIGHSGDHRQGSFKWAASAATEPK